MSVLEQLDIAAIAGSVVALVSGIIAWFKVVSPYVGKGISTLKKLKDAYEEMEKKVSSLEDKVSRLETTNSIQAQQLNSQVETIAELSALHSTLKESHDELHRDYDKAQDKIVALETRIDAQEGQINELMAINQALQVANDFLSDLPEVKLYLERGRGGRNE